MKKISAVLLLFLSTSIFAQSPWTKEKGDLFVNLSFTTISNYNKLFGDPDYNTERNITDRTYQIYGEYGFTNNTSLVFSVPLKSIKVEDFVPNQNLIGPITNSGTKTSFGNIQLGLKHQFYNNGWVLAGQLLSEINTSSYDDATGIRTGYDAFTFTPQFLAGKSFGKTFLQTHIGADIRTNNYSSNFKVGGEFGGKITQNIWLIGYVDVVKSFENGNINIPTNNSLTGLYVNDQEYGAYGLKGILQLCDLGITAGFGNAFFGNNVAKQTAFTIGIFNTF
ncbi:hypothetical protein JL193_09160 [Polaribacter batillariae]|uniref:MetA-pathway of phenol degradation n=1 Tax=Polaribacter batillariae TaxID=2808900 RepID=A0ABX7SQ37_9FLAO|nr:hypothetical protein [Polaribacter batillariae]QTD36332.1 hypothetical protein JL193_09160 [Polaribacter batillariae]